MSGEKTGEYLKLAIAAVRAYYGDFKGLAVEGMKKLPKIILFVAIILFIIIMVPILLIQSLFMGNESSSSGDTFGNIAIESLNYKENWLEVLAIAQTKRILTGSDKANFEEASQALKNNAIENLLSVNSESGKSAVDVYNQNLELLKSIYSSYGGYCEFYDEIPEPDLYSSINIKYNYVTEKNELIAITSYLSDTSTNVTVIYNSNDVVNYKVDSDEKKIKIKYRKYWISAFFPVHGDYESTFSNDYGGDRFNNGVHQGHEGIDIFAEKNTPLVAVEDCRITKIGWNGLGGWRILMESKDGNRVYYYAHLENYSEKLAKYKDFSGNVSQNIPEEVTAGEIIGYIGSSGSFSSSTPPGADTGTPPHLHIQLWVKSKGWFSEKSNLMNPYYSLKLLEINKYGSAYLNNIEKLKQEGL